MTPNKLPPREVVQAWSEASFDDEADAVSRAMRAQIVARMELRLEQTVAEVDTTRRRARTYAALGCAAALCLSAFGAWRWNRARVELGNSTGVARVESVEGSVSITHSGGAGSAVAPVTGATRLSPGDDVVTAQDGRTRVQLADGVSITLGEASHLGLPEAAAAPQPLAVGRERVRLDDGVVTVRVPHLTQGHTFAVQTPNTEVTVHGTAFTVEVGEFVTADQPLRSGGHAPNAPLTTRVRVTEGVVSVTNDGRELFLHPGMQWVSPHAEPAPQPTAPVPANGLTLLTPGVPPPNATFSLAQKPVANSTLGDQTRLLESAMAASKGGNYAGAISSLNELLRRYPSSGLAPEAHVQLFRALAGAHDYAGAGREARRYLAAYPEGYAHEEAKKLALEH
jgi:ferric-dicitrate binding protein FerR (iron transport regulator)